MQRDTRVTERMEILSYAKRLKEVGLFNLAKLKLRMGKIAG